MNRSVIDKLYDILAKEVKESHCGGPFIVAAESFLTRWREEESDTPLPRALLRDRRNYLRYSARSKREKRGESYLDHLRLGRSIIRKAITRFYEDIVIALPPSRRLDAQAAIDRKDLRELGCLILVSRDKSLFERFLFFSNIIDPYFWK